jgi:hypothetical protein
MAVPMFLTTTDPSVGYLALTTKSYGKAKASHDAIQFNLTAQKGTVESPYSRFVAVSISTLKRKRVVPVRLSWNRDGFFLFFFLILWSFCFRLNCSRSKLSTERIRSLCSLSILLSVFSWCRFRKWRLWSRISMEYIRLLCSFS